MNVQMVEKAQPKAGKPSSPGKTEAKSEFWMVLSQKNTQAEAPKKMGKTDAATEGTSGDPKEEPIETESPILQSEPKQEEEIPQKEEEDPEVQNQAVPYMMLYGAVLPIEVQPVEMPDKAGTAVASLPEASPVIPIPAEAETVTVQTQIGSGALPVPEPVQQTAVQQENQMQQVLHKNEAKGNTGSLAQVQPEVITVQPAEEKPSQVTQSNPIPAEVLQKPSGEEQKMPIGDWLKAKTLETTGEKTGEGSRMNLEELQSKVDKGQYFDHSQMISRSLPGLYGAKAADNAQSQEVPVMNQIAQGIQKGLTQQLQQFTIKLKPEGLGEIIIHLAASGGKTAVSIGVTNKDTQQMLAGEMLNLKEALKPLNAEVQELYHDAPGNTDMTSYQHSLFQNQGGRRQQTMAQHSSEYGSHPGEEELWDEDGHPEITGYTDGRWNTYI